LWGKLSVEGISELLSTSSAGFWYLGQHKDLALLLLVNKGFFIELEALRLDFELDLEDSFKRVAVEFVEG